MKNKILKPLKKPKAASKKTIHATSALTIILFMAGCVIPVPHRRMHSVGISATVIDARTDSPIQGAEIHSRDQKQLLTTADSAGRFEIPPSYGWHGAYLVGPISYSLLPHFAIPSPRPPFRIEAMGYRERAVSPTEVIESDKQTGEPIIRMHPK